VSTVEVVRRPYTVQYTAVRMTGARSEVLISGTYCLSGRVKRPLLSTPCSPPPWSIWTCGVTVTGTSSPLLRCRPCVDALIVKLLPAGVNTEHPRALARHVAIIWRSDGPPHPVHRMWTDQIDPRVKATIRFVGVFNTRAPGPDACYRDWETVVIVACSYGALYSLYCMSHSEVIRNGHGFTPSLRSKQTKYGVRCVYCWPPLPNLMVLSPRKSSAAHGTVTTPDIPTRTGPPMYRESRVDRSCVLFDTERAQARQTCK
jgi:hypothetical protein